GLRREPRRRRIQPLRPRGKPRRRRLRLLRREPQRVPGRLQQPVLRDVIRRPRLVIQRHRGFLAGIIKIRRIRNRIPPMTGIQMLPRRLPRRIRLILPVLRLRHRALRLRERRQRRRLRELVRRGIRHIRQPLGTPRQACLSLQPPRRWAGEPHPPPLLEEAAAADLVGVGPGLVVRPALVRAISAASAGAAAPERLGDHLGLPGGGPRFLPASRSAGLRPWRARRTSRATTRPSAQQVLILLCHWKRLSFATQVPDSLLRSTRWRSAGRTPLSRCPGEFLGENSQRSWIKIFQAIAVLVRLDELTISPPGPEPPAHGRPFRLDKRGSTN